MVGRRSPQRTSSNLSSEVGKSLPAVDSNNGRARPAITTKPCPVTGMSCTHCAGRPQRPALMNLVATPRTAPRHGTRRSPAGGGISDVEHHFATYLDAQKTSLSKDDEKEPQDALHGGQAADQ